jgi:hypothetical protein
VLLALAVVVYSLFFDVLSPEVANGGSVRSNLGPAFVLLAIVLTAVQAAYASGVLHLVTRSFYFDRRDYLKALFVASVLIFLYSGYYILVPYWGPYTFLTGPLRGVAPVEYLILGLWTAVVILATSLLIRRIYGFKRGEIRWGALLLITAGIFLPVLAFAEG